jgi:hypothetical protein
MKIPKNLAQLSIPASLAGAIIFAAVSGFLWINAEFVHAEDFKQQVKTLEVRGLERDKQMLEREVLKLEVKKATYPAKFDPVDKALLEKQQQDLKEVKDEISRVKAAK